MIDRGDTTATLTMTDVRANMRRWQKFADAHEGDVSLGSRIEATGAGHSYLWARAGNGEECVVQVPRKIAEDFPRLVAALTALEAIGDIVRCATCGRWVLACRAAAHAATHSAVN